MSITSKTTKRGAQGDVVLEEAKDTSEEAAVRHTIDAMRLIARAAEVSAE